MFISLKKKMKGCCFRQFVHGRWEISEIVFVFYRQNISENILLNYVY